MKNAVHIDADCLGIEKTLLQWQYKNGLIDEKITEGKCSNCERSYKKGLPIAFATTTSGKIVWWCKFKCKKHD